MHFNDLLFSCESYFLDLEEAIPTNFYLCYWNKLLTWNIFQSYLISWLFICEHMWETSEGSSTKTYFFNIHTSG